MRLARVVCAGWLAVGLLAAGAVSGPAAAQEKKKDNANKEKIVGNWEVVKTEEPIPAGAKLVLTFTKDGKLTITATLMGQTQKDERRYEVKGDKIESVRKEGGVEKKETDTIKTLDDKQLITVNAKGQKTEFKRVK